jgi:large subunit ribosomal protein L24
MHVRKGDTVVVISGNDKGKRGEIKSVLHERGRVVVDGVNLRWKHRKPNQKNPKGERVQLECSIHASNVMHLDPKTDAPTRRRPESAKGQAAKGAAKKGAKPPKKKKEAAAS